ncbi:MAG: FG-GAP repeat domain-containing protein [Akkermansiaceae bacterium]
MLARLLALALAANTAHADSDTEDLSRRAGSQLEKLATWVTSPNRGSPPPVFSPGATANPLFPATPLITSGGIHHGRLPVFEETTVSLATRLAAAPTATRAKFKIFTISLLSENPVTFETRQFFSLFSPGAATESTWRASWILPGGKTAPLLTSVTLEAHERTASPPLFTDTTARSLSTSPAAAHQLATSAPRWNGAVTNEIATTQNYYQGLAVGDADGDGWDDVYVCQGAGLPNRLLLTRAGGTTEDISAATGVDLLDRTRSALFIDFDNDGDQDLAIVTRPGVFIFENRLATEGRFVPRAKLAPHQEIFSLSSADYDADGFPDLFVCVYHGNSDAPEDRFRNRPAPQPFHDANNGGRSLLFRNTGGFAFTDVTTPAGLDADGSNRRFSLASGWEDADLDGDQDLYIANDFGRNCLYRNNGDGTFTNIAPAAGVEDSSFGMSVAWGDANRDSRPDLYVSNMFSAAGNRVTYQPGFKGTHPGEAAAKRYLARGNSLFTQNPGGTFHDSSVTSGTTMGRWSWASVFTDLDHDGWEDILVANGYLTNTNLEDDL